MADKIKGITIELNSDVSGVKKAFKELTKDSQAVERQLKDVNKALKLDPGNTTLLEAKQKLLAQAVEKTATQLEAARKAQEDFVASGGDVDSAQYIQMQVETERLAAHLGELENQSEQTADALEDSGNAAEESSEGIEEHAEATKKAADASGSWQVAIGNLISNGINKLISSVESAISSTFTLADDVATLANNYNISAEAAYTLYQNQGLFDYSVGAVTKGIKEQYAALAENTNAYRQYGIVTKNASGQMLSAEQIWINTIERLRQIQDPIKRAEIGVELLGNKYYELGGFMNASAEDFDEFKTSMLSTNEELQEDIEGMNKWNDAMDKAKMALADAIIGLGDFFGWLTEIDGLLPALLIALAGLAAAWLTFGGAAQIAAAAQAALNLVMMANPIGLVILAVTALIAIIVLLVYNCEWLQDALLALGETFIRWANNLKGYGQKIVDNLLGGIKSAWNKLVEWVEAAWNRLLSIFSRPIGVNVEGSGYDRRIDGRHASGLDYVPYDGYIAQLHRGERIQTADEAARDSGSGAPVINQYITSPAQSPVDLAAASRMYFDLARW